jgi:acylphosphatase
MASLRHGDGAVPRQLARVVVRVTGKVQGVNYRASAAREARQRGLAGWVRNEADGSVLVDVEGPQEALDAFVRWCGVGPPGATVRAVHTAPAAPAGYKEFVIQR